MRTSSRVAKARIPKLRHNLGALRADGTRCRGQAYIEYRGERFYLGVSGSPEVDRRYEKFKAAFGKCSLTALMEIGGAPPKDLMVSELRRSYWDYAKAKYQKHGEPTSQLGIVRTAFEALGPAEYADCPVKDFGRRKFSALRDAMVGAVDPNDPEQKRRRWSLSTIRKVTTQMRGIFRWGFRNELVPAEVLVNLKEGVEALTFGYMGGREAPRKTAVPADVVDATLLYLSPVVADMVRLQRKMACRPGEICVLRPGDIDFHPPRNLDESGKNWLYRPSRHKLEHKRIERAIWIGPEAQAILKPYLDRASVAYCFSPMESEARRKVARRAVRKTPLRRTDVLKMSEAVVPGRSDLGIAGDCYTDDSYRRAITRAIQRANAQRRKEAAEARLLPGEVSLLPYWHPNQLRHLGKQEIEARHGVEGARVVMGHKEVEMTRWYGNRDQAAAAAIAAAMG